MSNIYAAAHAYAYQGILSNCKQSQRQQLTAFQAAQQQDYMNDLVMGHSLSNYIQPKTCKYCGRVSQNRQHDNCDGCGAPKEG